MASGFYAGVVGLLDNPGVDDRVRIVDFELAVGAEQPMARHAVVTETQEMLGLDKGPIEIIGRCA